VVHQRPQFARETHERKNEYPFHARFAAVIINRRYAVGALPEECIRVVEPNRQVAADIEENRQKSRTTLRLAIQTEYYGRYEQQN